MSPSLPASPDRSYGRAEYHRIRQRLHGAATEDRMNAAAHRRDDELADRRSSLTRPGFSAVQATLAGLPHDLVWLLLQSRHEPMASCSPAGRLPRGPRAHLLACHVAQSLIRRQKALVIAAGVAQSVVHAERIARENAQHAMRVAA